MRDEIIKFLKEAIPEKLEINVNVPEEDRLGHYSTNVAFKLAKERKKNPFAVAHNIAEELHKIISEGIFHHIEVAEPGFINFWISEKALQSELQNILEKKSARGGSALGRKIQVEYVSANPTGPLTLANGRGGFLGDVLSNVLEWAGYKVEREYYVNDTGNQVLTLGKSILAASGLTKNEESFYKGSYIKSWANKHKAILKKNKDKPLKLGQVAAADFLKSIKSSLKKADIKFNRYTSEEKNIHKKGFVDKALKEFKNKKLVYKKEGAEWLKTTNFHDDKDRVVITSDGYPTYFLADAGHYLETKLRGFDTKVLILGPDHYGYVSRIQAAAEILGLKNSKIIITQAIRLTKEGKEVKMSKRSGEFETFEELLKEVGVDSARFFFLMHSPN
ncbi:MAG: arginine--tRNA ligase, partial [Patescibacteria group bacterium]